MNKKREEITVLTDMRTYPCPLQDFTATAAKSLIFVRTILIPRSSLALSSKTLDL